MPAEILLDHAARIVRSNASGYVTESEILMHMGKVRALFADGTLTPAWGQIIDFREATGVDELTGGAIREFARKNPWPVTAFRAFVTDQDLAFGLVRMYQILADIDPENSVITDSIPAAEAWLAERMRSQRQDP